MRTAAANGVMFMVLLGCATLTMAGLGCQQSGPSGNGAGVDPDAGAGCAVDLIIDNIKFLP